MKRGVTWIVFGAVGLIAALAAADALRPSSGEQRAAVPTASSARPRTLRETLRAEGVTGFVLYSDRDCRLHSLLLPRLVDEVVRGDNGAGAFHICRFSLAGGRIRGELDRASPDGTELVRCRGNVVSVVDASSGRVLSRARGCPAAWRPDGRLTRVRRGEVVQGRYVVLSRKELRAAARNHPSIAGLRPQWPIRVFVTDLAWLDEEHVVVSMEIDPVNVEPQFLAVLFDGKAIVGLAGGFHGPYEHWLVSPSGRLAASEDGTIMARDGGSTDPVPGVPQGRAVAFSPDERWLAWVSGVSIYLIATPRNVERGRVIRLPVPAQDLVWEPVSSGTSIGPPRNR